MTNSIIDLSHFQSTVNLEAAKAAGIQALIHKCTQGVGMHDHLYAERKATAKQLGLLFGSYHFGDGTDGKQQAEWFLSHAQADANTLLVLDLEENTGGSSMKLQQAYDFLCAVKFQTGRWPVLYAGEYLRELMAGKPDAILNNCPLWISDYRVKAQPEILAGWNDWAMWQYTDDEHGNPPHSLAGINECDRDIFNGTPEGLLAFWNGAPAAA